MEFNFYVFLKREKNKITKEGNKCGKCPCTIIKLEESL